MIDLVGYRRWGHNEGDEPAFTHPKMYETIRTHPTVRQLWAEKLEHQGVTTREEAEALLQAAFQRLEQARSGAPPAEGDESDPDRAEKAEAGPAGFLTLESDPGRNELSPARLEEAVLNDVDTPPDLSYL